MPWLVNLAQFNSIFPLCCLTSCWQACVLLCVVHTDTGHSEYGGKVSWTPKALPWTLGLKAYSREIIRTPSLFAVVPHLQNEAQASGGREQMSLQEEVCVNALFLVPCHRRAWGHGASGKGAEVRVSRPGLAHSEVMQIPDCSAPCSPAPHSY